MTSKNPTNYLPQTAVHHWEHDPYAKIPEGWSLASWQKALVAASALRRGKKVKEAAQIAQVDSKTLWEWRKRPSWVEAEKFVEKQGIFELRGAAFNELGQMVTNPDVPPATKLAAIKFVLERTDANFVDPKLKLGWDAENQESTMAEFDGMTPDDLRALLNVVRSGVDVKALVAQAKGVIEIGSPAAKRIHDEEKMTPSEDLYTLIEDAQDVIDAHDEQIAQEDMDYQMSKEMARILAQAKQVNERSDWMVSGGFDDYRMDLPPSDDD